MRLPHLCALAGVALNAYRLRFGNLLTVQQSDGGVRDVVISELTVVAIPNSHITLCNVIGDANKVIQSVKLNKLGNRLRVSLRRNGGPL
jgi:methylaspartate ammonia-lyase